MINHVLKLVGINSQLRLDIERHNSKVDRNRNIFQRLIDVECFLGKQELAFHGHDESLSSLNRGNYLETVDLLAKYDGVLETHLQNASTLFTSTSNRTQNDLISSVASVMTIILKTKLNSPILRYFRGSEVVDRFIKYIDVSADRTAVTLSSIILETLADLYCHSKLIA